MTEFIPNKLPINKYIETKEILKATTLAHKALAKLKSRTLIMTVRNLSRLGSVRKLVRNFGGIDKVRNRYFALQREIYL